jgi:hypothetical protein
MRQTTACRASGDDPARFLKELRQLRDGAGLGPAELAARAHYPYDRIRAAEAGPALPDLPVLSAYVRGCGGTTEEWEERWRSLTSAQTLPLLAARPAGSSTAASAGARIGSASPAADTPDPSIILAALDRVAEGMAVAAPAALPSRSGLSTLDQLPGVAAAAPDPAGAKPGVGQTSASAVSVTGTTRTAWGTPAAPTGWETDQTAAGAESATGEAEVTGVAEAGGPDVRRAAVTPARSAAIPPTTAATAPATAPATSAGARPSRTTVLAAIAVMICVLVAALAIFA